MYAFCTIYALKTIMHSIKTLNFLLVGILFGDPASKGHYKVFNQI